MIAAPAKDSRNNNPLCGTHSDTSEIDNQEPARKNKPLRRSLFGTPPRATTGPSTLCDTVTPIPKRITLLERLRNMKDMVMEMEQIRCWKVMCEEYVEHADPPHQPWAIADKDDEQVKEECVEVKKLKEGGLKVELSCSCGNGFEIQLKDKLLFLDIDIVTCNKIIK